MGKIVLEIEEFGKTHTDFRSFDQGTIRIGRAFNNDLIINDPFVSALHISLKFIEGRWICEDDKSLNGAFISPLHESQAKIKVDGTYPVSSGDTIFLGKTIIHVWDIDHPVAPEQVLDKGAYLALDPRRRAKSLVFNLAAFCFVYYLFLSQLSWRNNGSSFQGIAATGLLLFMLVVWSALWAFITRFTKRQHRFLQHLIFSFQWAIISLGLSFVLKYMFFFICNYDIYYAGSLLAFGLFTIFVLNIHLAIGTNLSLMKRVMISGAITFFIILLSILGHYAVRNEFNPNPHHFINMVPVGKKFIPTIPINEEMKRLDSIF